MKRAALFASLLLAGACAETAPVAQSPGFQTSASPAVPFAPWERARLVELASVDPRLAQRLRLEPSEADSRRAVLGAILAEDPTLRVVGKRADSFSFDLRSRELDRIATLVSAPPVFDAAERESSSAEVTLLSRLVSSERARVDEERRLPGSASALVRGVVATWTTPGSMEELHDLDAWLGARLDEVTASMASAPLRAVEETELEDALDPLERRADPGGYPKAQAALARLRVALGAAHGPPGVGMGWPELHARLDRHLGWDVAEGTLREELARTLARLRSQAKAELAALPEPLARDAVARGVAPWLAEDTCAASGSGPPQGVRALAPPPERRLSCSLLHAIASSPTEAASVAALIALHDAVALAAAALAMHVDQVAPDLAARDLHLLADPPIEGTGRLVRFAAVRPVACLAVVEMAALLGDGGLRERRERAAAWLAFGDAPLDLVARALPPR